MKKVVALFMIFFLCSFKTADVAPVSAFQAGEWFRFRVHYGIFNASVATLQLKNDRLNGKEMYHVIGKGRTTGLARLFFKVDDNYESYFDKVEGKPYKFIRQIDEGGYTKNLEINFDHLAKKAIVLDKKKNRKTILSTPDDVQDLLSAFYYIRNNYEIEDLQVGKSISLNMLFDDDETFVFKLKYLGEDLVRTKFGKIKCAKFRPYVQAGRVFKEKESLTLWVSADKNKVPVRIKADLAVGSIKADLDAFKGLKYQFKIKM